MQSSAESPRVLIVDDEESQRTGLAGLVSSWGFEAATASDGLEALEKLRVWPASALITDIMMPRMDGFELLARLSEQGNAIPAIVLTAYGNPEAALATVRRLGAYWFEEKPVTPKRLRTLLEGAVLQARLVPRQDRLDPEDCLGELVGSTPGMQQVFSLIRQVAPSKAAVLVTGESGTGKELVARAVHALSPRSQGPFVAINCAAMPETLMESELFGHEKGAFTGAVERRAGCFELAQGGTLLLDEIGDMPAATQAKLLRVLEDSRVRRLGAKSEVLVDVRVIAATNKDLQESMRGSSFREDLFYRLNVFEIHLPALRERMDDLPLLGEALIRDLNRKHGYRVSGVSTEAMDRLRRYPWPGNVRELRNVLERSVILAREGLILPAHLPPKLGAAGAVAALGGSAAEGTLNLPVGVTVEQAERALIELTLQHTKNNKTRAAEILGISLKTLFNKLKEYEGNR